MITSLSSLMLMLICTVEYLSNSSGVRRRFCDDEFSLERLAERES